MDKFTNITLTIFFIFFTLALICAICKSLIKFIERTAETSYKTKNTNILDILRIILNIDVTIILILFFICWFAFLIFIDISVIEQQKDYSTFIIIFSIPFYLAGIYGVIKTLFKKKANYC